MVIYVDALGLMAGMLTTLSLFPEILRTAKMKETRDLSPGWLEMLGAGTILWTAYGILINSVPIIIANSLSFLSVLILVYLKLRYK